MTKTDTLQRIGNRARLLRLSPRTEKSYIAWARQYIDYITTTVSLPDDPARKVEAFLTRLALRPVAASTQNQALAALCFMYNEVLQQPITGVNALRAHAPERMPTIVSHAQAMAAIHAIAPEYRAVCLLLYGSGLRLMECLRLRVKDVDVDGLQVIVRGGKGDKDRPTLMARAAVETVVAQIALDKAIFEYDYNHGCANVWLPDALADKYPNARSELGWQWLFPAAHLSTDPRTGQARRHHLHPQTVGRAIKQAGKEAGIERLTAHVFRHTFATELARGGMQARELAAIMGHRDIRTTEVYIHLAAANGHEVTSPADKE